ncbi:MAG: DUF1887 family protein [Anaerolineales bacterium]|nr:DUF1887 family protein [Anaerolineales bacterium]
MTEKVMLLLVGGRSATPALMGALQFIHEVNRVKFLLCEHKDDQYLTFQKIIMRLLRVSQPDLLCDDVRDVKTVDGNNFDQVTTAVTQLCADISDLHFVNLTSVPQSMSFAVYHYLHDKHPQALPFSIYTHKSQLIPLASGKKTQRLTKKLTVDQYVTACDTAVFQYKFDVKRLSCTPEQAVAVAGELAENIAQTDKLLAIIRKAGENIKTPKTIHINKLNLSKHVDNEDLRRFMQRLYEAGLISRFTEQDTRFSYRVETQHDHAFLYGDWLEYYVYLQAKEAGFDSVKMAVELKDFKGEIDLIAVHNANALICECKTGKFSSTDLARLESKAIKLGGNYCVRLFISTAQKAENDPGFEKLCRQAANRRIVVVTGDDLPQIEKKLKREMEQPTYSRT